MTRKLSLHRVLTAAILTLAVSTSIWPGTATAQENDGWKFRISPYLWMLGLDGTTAALGSDVEVDASFGDILDKLNIALSANMELSNGKFFVVFDPMYAQLETEYAGTGGGPVGGKIDIDMLIADLDVGFSMDENFDFYAGLRYYDQDIGITPNLLPKVTLGDDWTDFILGFRFHTSISDKWSFTGNWTAPSRVIRNPQCIYRLCCSGISAAISTLISAGDTTTSTTNRVPDSPASSGM